MSSLCIAGLTRVLAHPDDTASHVARKVVWAMVLAVATFFCFLAVPVGLRVGNTYLLSMGFVCTPISVGITGNLFYTRRMTHTFIAVAATFMCVLITWFDLSIMAVGYRGWSFFVILIDALLVANAPSRIRAAVVSWVCVWLSITAVEMALRYGLLDLPGSRPYEGRQVVCEQPPCAQGFTGLLNYVTPIVVLLTDYKATMGFAVAVEEEKTRMQHAISVSRRVARCLARFNLDEARSEMQDEEAAHLPAELVEAFEKLLSNLQLYRPYLPQSLIEDCGDDDEVAVESADTVDSLSSSDIGSDHGRPGRLSNTPSASTVMSYSDNLSRGPRERRSSVISSSSSHKLKTTSVPTVTNQPQLRKDVVTVMLARCALAGGVVEPKFDVYVKTHSRFLTELLSMIKTTKGILSHFSGDDVYASYNAFRRVATHAQNAMEAADKHIRTCEMHDKFDSSAAITTGPALVGNLGNEAVLSPVIMGELMGTLGPMAAAGRRLGHKVVCSPRTFTSVSFAQPLRWLLHKVLLPAMDVETGILSHTAVQPWPAEGLLVALVDREGSECKMKPAAADEWLYAMQNEPGKRWEVFNDAARRLHVRGEEDARKYLDANAVDDDVRQVFMEEAAERVVIDFRMHLRPLCTHGAGPDQPCGAAEVVPVPSHGERSLPSSQSSARMARTLVL